MRTIVRTLRQFPPSLQIACCCALMALFSALLDFNFRLLEVMPVSELRIFRLLLIMVTGAFLAPAVILGLTAHLEIKDK